MKPFQGPTYATPQGPLVTYERSADDRNRWVARCDDPALLNECLRVHDLQKTVRTGIERRLRALAKTAAMQRTQENQ